MKIIKNEKQIEEYKNELKLYVPEDYYNENYQYRYNNKIITIVTNNNCRTQYNTTYCNCYNYFTEENITSEVYECSNNTNQYTIPIEKITTDINNNERIRNDYMQETMINYFVFIIAIAFVIAMLTREVRY